MLITFSCDAYENITLFGDVAKRLLVLMGHSGTTPGAILAEDVPTALAHLQKAIEHEKQHGLSQRVKSDDDEDEISLAMRAVPVIGLLQAASKAKCDVLWK